MLYLLFYYTDALAIGMELAATIYLAASVWDGLASFVVGVIADRHGSARHYRLALLIGAAPLGLAFVIAYMPPPVAGAAGVAFVLGGHLLFRTAYALVNVPYLAMSARISADSRDRALVAGLRMLAGTGAAVVVAMGTVPVGTMLAGVGGPRAYLFARCCSPRSRPSSCSTSARPSAMQRRSTPRRARRCWRACRAWRATARS